MTNVTYISDWKIAQWRSRLRSVSRTDVLIEEPEEDEEISIEGICTSDNAKSFRRIKGEDIGLLEGEFHLVITP